MTYGTISPFSDTELLARFGASRSPHDFAEIVSRHGGMVLRTCLRLTGNRQDAEDAAQATFVVLAEKAAGIRESLAGWLHKVARDSALHVVRERVRRVRREEASVRMKKPPSEDFGEMREEIDAALDHLPARLREAVVLRYLEGRDHEEAARLAGCNAATFRWRSMKGLEQLRTVLGRRGAVFTLTALAVFLAQEAAASAASTIATGSLSAWAVSAAAGAETGRAGLIAKGILKSMFWAKIKLYAAATAVTVALAGFTVPLILPDEKLAMAPAPANPMQLGLNASLGGFQPFPSDNPWNQDVSAEPVDPHSDAVIGSVGRDKSLFPAFGTTFRGMPNGISYWVVSGEHPKVPVEFHFPKESDPGPYPIPPGFPIYRDHTQLIVLDRDNGKLYELSDASFNGTTWRGTAGAVFDLKSNELRPRGWTSADPAGLPIFPGLVRYDEVAEQKAIRHALRFTCKQIRAAFVAPARHCGATSDDPRLPPLGMRVRLRADFDITGFPPSAQVILTALKQYGMILAEQGTDWYLNGVPDPRWNDLDLKTLQRVRGADFEVLRMGKVETRR